MFEDETLKLEFDYKKPQFFIKQENKERYSFQHLSSGFSSILAIYADLITRIQLKDVKPNELKGVVLIDKIDAHLHVSLQRKIFNFLTTAFPSIQFIVTTHSPFVKFC